MRELQSSGLIALKGMLLLVISVSAATLLLLERPSLREAALLALLVWSACRFYYFLFYVLEKYVDPNLRYAGLLALMGAFKRTRTSGPN